MILIKNEKRDKADFAQKLVENPYMYSRHDNLCYDKIAVILKGRNIK